jgi:WD40 repeat protein
VNAVAFHPSGARILTASTDGTLRVWRLTSSTAKRVILTGHDGAVNGIALHRDGRFFATASSDGTIKIWAMGSLLPMATLIALPEDGFAALLREGSYKIEGDGDARLWWAMKLCRFGPGELDPYVPEITRLPADAPILPEA